MPWKRKKPNETKNKNENLIIIDSNDGNHLTEWKQMSRNIWNYLTVCKQRSSGSYIFKG